MESSIEDNEGCCFTRLQKEYIILNISDRFRINLDWMDTHKKSFGLFENAIQHF